MAGFLLLLLILFNPRPGSPAAIHCDRTGNARAKRAGWSSGAFVVARQSPVPLYVVSNHVDRVRMRSSRVCAELFLYGCWSLLRFWGVAHFVVSRRVHRSQSRTVDSGVDALFWPAIVSVRVLIEGAWWSPLGAESHSNLLGRTPLIHSQHHHAHCTQKTTTTTPSSL